MTTKEQILTSTISILARDGYAATSMRKVAAAIQREPSIIYVHFNDKEALLRATRHHIIKLLAEKQAELPATSAHGMMQAIVRFQLENRLYIVALLQYFMSMRQDFPLEDGGYVPPRSYDHMTRVLQQGIIEGVYCSDDLHFDAKTMVHLINGFLMEYFDKQLTVGEVTGLCNKLVERLEKLVAIKQVGA